MGRGGGSGPSEARCNGASSGIGESSRNYGVSGGPSSEYESMNSSKLCSFPDFSNILLGVGLELE